MNNTKIATEHLITNTEQLRELFPTVNELALHKCQSQLDKHSIDFISRSPFVCIGTQDKNGNADVSPRGDPNGFVKILDNNTIVIPERPGNNRLDTLENIVANPSVGLLFLIPGFDETMRVNGRAFITRDPELLAKMAVKDRNPIAAILIEIDEVFIHCAKAFRRSKLWDSATHQNRAEMPSIAQIVFEQLAMLPDDPAEMVEIDKNIEEQYKTTLY